MVGSSWGIGSRVVGCGSIGSGMMGGSMLRSRSIGGGVMWRCRSIGGGVWMLLLWWVDVGVLGRVFVQVVQGYCLPAVHLIPVFTGKLVLVKQCSVGTHEPSSSGTVTTVVAHSVHLTSSLWVRVHARLEGGGSTAELCVRSLSITGVVHASLTRDSVVVVLLVVRVFVVRFGLMIGGSGFVVGGSRFVVGGSGRTVGGRLMISWGRWAVGSGLVIGRSRWAVRSRFMVSWGRWTVRSRFMISRCRRAVRSRFMVSWGRRTVWSWFMIGRWTVRSWFMVSWSRRTVWSWFMIGWWTVGSWFMVSRGRRTIRLRFMIGRSRRAVRRRLMVRWSIRLRWGIRLRRIRGRRSGGVVASIDREIRELGEALDSVKGLSKLPQLHELLAHDQH